MNRFRRILCVIEPGPHASSLLERAVSLAQSNQAALTVVSIAPSVSAGRKVPKQLSSVDLQKAVVAYLQQEQQNLIAPFQLPDTITTKVLEGTSFLEIIREVLRSRHDLVMKSPEDPSWIDRLFGSDDMHLLRKCPCPVWLVKQSSSTSYKRILAAVDVDTDYPASEQTVRRRLNVSVLELAISLALSDFAELHVAHAWEAIGESAMRGAFLRFPEAEVTTYVRDVHQQHIEELDGLLRDVIREQGGDAVRFLEPNKHVIKGEARKEIPALAKSIEADLVVMGTVARSGVAGLFIGNTAEAILEQIDCSVLAVKPEGFVTPVTLS